MLRKLAKVLGIIIATLVGIALAFVVSVILWLHFYHRDLPDVGQLKAFAPTAPAVITYNELGRSTHTTVLPRSQISDALRNAVLAAEGRMDTRNWLVAFVQNFGSISSRSGLRYSLRNAQEIAHGSGWLHQWRTSIQIDRRFTTDEILTIYMNRVYLGHDLFGVEDGSLYYFGKHAGGLNTEEAALIAGIMRRPTYLSPEQHPDRALKRRNEVIDRMLQNGKLTAAEAERAKNAPISLVSSNLTKTAEELPCKESSVDTIIKTHVYAQAADSVHSVDFKNLRLVVFDGNKETNYLLRDGKYSKARTNEDPFFEEVALESAYYFDYAAQKAGHALVVFDDSAASGSSTDDGIVQVFAIKRGHPVVLQQFRFDKQAPGTEVKFDAGKNILTITARSRDDSAHCCPENIDRAVYRWNGSTFELQNCRTIALPPGSQR